MSAETNESAVTVHEGVAVSLGRAELDHQVATAKAYPRSLSRFTREIKEMISNNPEVADECIYALPRGGKSLEGPSVRLAEIVASAWGNCQVGARIVDEGPEFVTAQAVFRDLERNVCLTYESKRRITDRDGKRFNADMIGVTSNACMAVAFRNVVLKGVPKVFWRAGYDLAEHIVKGSAETLVARRDKAMNALQKLGVSARQVFDAMGVAGLEDIGIDHLTRLAGMATAIRDGDMTVDQAFPAAARGSVETPAPAPKSGVAGLKSTLDPDPDPSGGALAQDRRSTTTDGSEAAGAPGDGAVGKDAPATDGQPDASVSVVRPLDDLAREKVRKSVKVAIKGRGWGEAQLLQFLADETGRAVPALNQLTDSELQGISLRLGVR